MKRKVSLAALAFLALAAALACAAVGAQLALRAHRPASAPPMAEGTLAALGGLRSIAAEIVWFRADRLQEEGRYVELAQLASTLSFLEPHTPEVWSYAAWNLAYNISIMMPTHEDRWRWVHAAIRLLRDEGIVLNPRDPELYRELAWMFELKLGTNLDAAVETYRAKWREIVEDVARRGAWQELRMEPAAIEEVKRAYGVDDVADAQFSTLYWAHAGLACATRREDALFLNEIARQARAIYFRTRGEKKEE